MISRSWFASAVGDERELLQRATTLLQTECIDSDRKLNELLQNTVMDGQVNLATALFYQYILAHEKHGTAYSRVQRQTIAKPTPDTSAHIVIVPGMFAKEKPDIGGDGALLKTIASSLGLTVSTAPTNTQASVSENADVLHQYLQQMQSDHVWIVSLSRGSADVKFMLSRHKTATYLPIVKQWISVSGIVTGTPLFQRILKRPVYAKAVSLLCTLRGISARLPVELDASYPFWSESCDQYPFGVTHVAPIPLDWHVTRPVQPRYARLKHLGPTDGIVMLTELLAQQGTIYPIWGADHMLRVPNLANHFYQLIEYLKEDL